MTVIVLGAGSEISQKFKTRVLPHEELIRGSLDFVDVSADKYLICSGFLSGDNIRYQSEDIIKQTFMVNYIKIIDYCDYVFDHNRNARICIIGSESGYQGSYDMAYAGAKAALHMYIENKKLYPEQQLVGISPWIIEDAGMTLRRKDTENLELKKEQHPKKRFLKSVEVARLAFFLLFVDSGFITNTVIRMHGGKH